MQAGKTIGSPAMEGMRQGRLERTSVDAPELGRQVEVLAYLPRSYDERQVSYPVLYFQDGQNLFDPETAYASSWRVDLVLDSLAADGLEAIAVGLGNAGEGRIREYSPYVDRRHGGGGGEAYVRFLLERAMPLVEGDLRVRRGPASTAILGSSLGGLISLWAGLRHPEVFGRIAALSPSLGFAGGAIFGDRRLTLSRRSRVYLDVGTDEIADATLFEKLFRGRSSLHYRWQVRRMARRLRRAGSDVKWVEEKGGRHREEAWAGRLPEALRFLLSSSERLRTDSTDTA